MTQQTTEPPGLTRRLMAALPAPVAKILRGVKRALLNTRSRLAVFTGIAETNS